MLIDNQLYLLVEGEPDSPEMFFFEKVIPAIIANTGANITPQIIEVGSSSAFNAFARVGYRVSELHKVIPILAIADSDYRTPTSKQQDNSPSLIKNKKPKILYWPRHEWENYLLEETEWLADWINQLPVKPQNPGRPSALRKSYKISTQPANQTQLDNFLENYFRHSIRTEYWECLKFNLAVNIKDYPSVEKPANFDTQTPEEIKQWFDLQANQAQMVMTLKKKPVTLFEDIMQELPWKTWLTSPLLMDRKLARQHCRGKEAFLALCQFLAQKFEIHNFDQDLLIKDLLRHLASNRHSAIFQDLQSLLLPEL